MLKHPLPRLDKDDELKNLLLPYCRFSVGTIWIDKLSGHKIACGDATNINFVQSLFENKKASLAIHDPPYNFIAFKKSEVQQFIEWSKKWIEITYEYLKANSSLYIWLGADQKNNFQPLSSFIEMMSSTKFKSRSFITMRNQRGFGTQKNWMAIRQELLFYKKGNPYFNVEAEYTDIPKVLKGYYKSVSGKLTENLERSKSENIRAGNVWIDIQQVFYRMGENVNGCYAQKPLKAIERIIQASSKKNDIVFDCFAHSGTTLIASEKLKRKCFTIDIEPVFCEISLRRLEKFRYEGKTGWQNSNPFANEIQNDKKLKTYLNKKYKLEY
ncbi:DNA modification methylase [Ignavibacterium album JCM 16511]|uniref:Methyltransferase n=1 Tax=Ignavibacterium album (strain DSM 19864 / JCM 16511 / NBRC 101810 / Mat9-16) TaxID=945713 RepID=I0AKK9_IGNAJ|nr:site-specific DNA-methyltransferase [Ignavibacterium album]AFH49516.1 DNA modification methylase [Ignavibacterium album JCM 16511]